MKPVLTIREESVEVPTDSFYRVLENIIDQANPHRHITPRLDVLFYPPKVYETIRKLKE